MAITYPPVFINEYISEKVLEKIPEKFSGTFRFFPTLPTDINSLTENFPGEANDVFAVYDRMFKNKNYTFPHIKTEQVIYYLYKMNGNPEALFETLQIISDLLDRKDESGEELNHWIASKVNSDGLVSFGSGSLARDFKPVYFHELRVYQLEETRDIINYQTARTYSGSKLIVDYEYHVKDYS